MAVWKFFNGKVEFKRNPRVGKATNGKGWIIEAFSTDPTYYGGKYLATVGGAAFSGVNGTFKPFKLKRDAMRALEDANSLGLFN